MFCYLKKWKQYFERRLINVLYFCWHSLSIFFIASTYHKTRLNNTCTVLYLGVPQIAYSKILTCRLRKNCNFDFYAYQSNLNSGSYLCETSWKRSNFCHQIQRRLPLPPECLAPILPIMKTNDHANRRNESFQDANKTLFLFHSFFKYW